MASNNNDAELRRRLKILVDQLAADKVVLQPDSKIHDGLRAMKFGPDGEIDLSTVSSVVRAAALAVSVAHDRQELKKLASLGEIQSAYFRFLEINFGEYFREMKKHGVTPHAVASAVADEPEEVKGVTDGLGEFLASLEKFWTDLGEIAQVHIEDLDVPLKAVYGGDLFPSKNANIASRIGIYSDTIVLPDPFMRSKFLFERWEPAKQAYYAIKHGLNLLQYKDLALAEVPVPIVVIAPDRGALDESERKFYMEIARQDAAIHGSKIFGRNFANFDDLLDFAKSLDTPEKVEKEAREPSRILFDTEWNEPIQKQIQRITNDDHAKLLGTKNPGLIVAHQAVGRMTVSNEILIKSARYRGVPVIDAPTSWKYFSWKLEYDASIAQKELNLGDLHIVKNLQELGKEEIAWLGRVPTAALLEIRRQDAIPEIRQILGKGIAELVASKPLNFHRSRDQIFDNINSSLDEHRKRIAELTNKKWKFAGKEIGSWLAFGTVEIAAAITSSPALAISAYVAHQVLADPLKLREIPAAVRSLIEETKELNRSPVGLLFKISEEG